MGKRVLLIEDEANIVEAISFVLSRGGFTVHTHDDGSTAVAKALANLPQMIILDVMLPNKSGFEVLAALKAKEELREIPVLMLTARGQEKDREKAFALAADYFMTKPFSNSGLLGLVQKVLEP